MKKTPLGGNVITLFQSHFLDVDHLQDVAGLSTKQSYIRDNEEMLILRGLEYPPWPRGTRTVVTVLQPRTAMHRWLR
ncbi:hypothetical protein SLA2020_265100 [Shorea laevis]